MLWSWAVQWDGHSRVWPRTLELWLVWRRMESWAWSHFVSVVCTRMPLQDEVLAGARRYSGSSSTLGPSITHKGQARGQVLTVAAPTASCNSKIPSCFYYIRFSDSFLCWVLMLFHLWQYFLLKWMCLVVYSTGGTESGKIQEHQYSNDWHWETIMQMNNS